MQVSAAQITAGMDRPLLQLPPAEPWVIIHAPRARKARVVAQSESSIEAAVAKRRNTRVGILGAAGREAKPQPLGRAPRTRSP